MGEGGEDGPARGPGRPGTSVVPPGAAAAGPSASPRAGRVALLDCEDSPCLGGCSTYHDALRWDQAGEWQHFRCWKGEFPDQADIASGAVYAVVVTGSHHSVNDSERNPWMLRLFEFLRFCIARGDVGVFGVCFGHQAIARALGSRVGANASGRYRLGVEEVTPAPALLSHPDFQKARSMFRPSGLSEGEPLRLLESHGECVETLPEGATLLASSTHAPVEIFSVGDTVLSVQCHPEIDMARIREKTLPCLMKMGRIADDEAEAIRAELSGTVDHNFLRFMAPAFLHHNSKKQRSRSSSVEAGVPPTLAEDVVAQKIEQLSVEMFENVGAAIRGEFTPAILEYQLLAKMNKVASDNYQNMADFAQGVAVFVESLKAKHTELLPAVERIDEMESEVAQMEAIVQQIDNFSKSLESRVNRVIVGA